MVERPIKIEKMWAMEKSSPTISKWSWRKVLVHCHPSLPCNIAFGFYIAIARSPWSPDAFTVAHDGRTLQSREDLAETWRLSLEIQSHCMRLYVAGWWQQSRIWTTSPVSGTSDWTASWCLTGLNFCWQSLMVNCLWWSVQRRWPLVSFVCKDALATKSWDSETPGDKEDILMNQDISARRSCSY